MTPTIQIHPFPLVIDRSPYVLGDQQITLHDIEQNIFTVAANLPKACQTLYHNVYGAKIALDDPLFDDFSEAIRWSLATPGKLGYKLLEKKAGGGPESPKWKSEYHKLFYIGFERHKMIGLPATYLRITLGQSLGNSPGQPYVVEIWPPGHYSSIHDHGNACAVIKVRLLDFLIPWFGLIL